MRKEYDLRGRSRPNPYARRLGASGRQVLVARFLHAEKLVRLDDEVAAEFQDEASVNEALRLVARLRKVGVRRPRKTRRAAAS